MTEDFTFNILEKELQPYKKLLGEAADRIMDQEVSKYPIFVAHQYEVDIGVLLVDRDQSEGNWSINASSLEEFATKNIIRSDRIENFREVYKDPLQHLCFFVLSEMGANFVFLPRGVYPPDN